MDSKKCTIRSKSSTLIKKDPKSLFNLTPVSTTPSSLKSPKSLEKLPKTTRHSSQYPPTLLHSPSSATKYIPSYTRSASKGEIKVLSKKKIFCSKKVIHEHKASLPPSKLISNFNSKRTPKKSLIIKLQKPVPHLPIPNFIHKIGSITQTGTTNSHKPKANNQDSFFIHENFANVQSQTLLCVLDGHGMFGHQISDCIKRMLPVELEKNMPIEGNIHSVNSPKLPVSVLSELKSSISTTFASIQKSLSAHKHVDATYSGTTVNLVYIHNKTLICTNVGDSRAVLGRFNGEWEAYELSQDHKPNNECEKRRIEKCGGRVEPAKDSFGRFVGPFRVWLKYEPLPGLAMSRSIGDLLASSVGVSAEPDISFHTLGSCDKFVVLATDGLWEFVNSLACVKIVAKWYEKDNAEKAAEELCKFAVSMWKENELCVDDITIIVVFFRVT